MQVIKIDIHSPDLTGDAAADPELLAVGDLMAGTGIAQGPLDTSALGGLKAGNCPDLAWGRAAEGCPCLTCPGLKLP